MTSHCGENCPCPPYGPSSNSWSRTLKGLLNWHRQLLGTSTSAIAIDPYLRPKAVMEHCQNGISRTQKRRNIGEGLTPPFSALPGFYNLPLPRSSPFHAAPPGVAVHTVAVKCMEKEIDSRVLPDLWEALILWLGSSAWVSLLRVRPSLLSILGALSLFLRTCWKVEIVHMFSIIIH